MSGKWGDSNRRQELPENWTALCLAVSERAGGRCQARWADGSRCDHVGKLECDHIVPGKNHNMSNLQALCAWHHKAKTNREASEARRAQPNHGKHPRYR